MAGLELSTGGGAARLDLSVLEHCLLILHILKYFERTVLKLVPTHQYMGRLREALTTMRRLIKERM